MTYVHLADRAARGNSREARIYYASKKMIVMSHNIRFLES